MLWIVQLVLASTCFGLGTQNAAIEKIINSSKISKGDFGIFIGSSQAEPIFELNKNKKMIPASISKIATTSMILEQFPPGTKFKTQLLSSAAIENEKLQGDLYLLGGGDPSFVSENLWFLVNAFTRNKIKIISGDIIVDDQLFDQLRFDPSRQDVRVDRAYDAPTGAMSFNWNSVNVYVRPGKKVGDPAAVFADPENEYIELKGNIKTVAADSENKIEVERENRSQAEGDLIKVSGKIALSSNEVVVFKNITHPDIWAGYNLRAFLRQRGIEVSGKIKSGTVSSKAVVLAESESKAVENILADMNKFSNNYVAEMLSKSAAAKVEKPGSISKAMDLIKEHLLSLGIAKTDFDLKNPSGLTRDNQITPVGMWKILFHLKEKFSYQPEVMSSLPIAGIDGTLKKRMKNTVAERMVRAKTGFLTGVVSLAGYLQRKSGEVVTFVMMYNGSDDEAEVRAIFDKICLKLVE